MTTTKTETQNQGEIKKAPDFYIHAVIPNGRKDRVGSRIGRAFNHKSGDGFSIYLDACPIPVEGQISLVAYPPSPKA